MACQATGCTSSGTALTLGASATGGTIVAGMTISWPAQQGISTVVIDAGGNYTGNSGGHTYTSVPLTGGTGSGAQATVVVASSTVTSVTITAAGTGYSLTDQLSAAIANLGNTGTGGLNLSISALTGEPLTPAFTIVSGSSLSWTTSAALGIGAGGTTLTFTAFAIIVGMATIKANAGAAPPVTSTPLGVAIPAEGYAAIPPKPLPQTLFGSTTQTSYST